MAMDIYLPHIQHISRQFAEWTQGIIMLKAFASLLHLTIIYLTHQALFKDVEDLVKLAISSSEMSNGPQSIDTATVYSGVFYFYVMQQKFLEALPYGRKALEIRKTLLGLSHNSTRSSIHSLAYVYDSLIMYTDATQLFQMAADACDGVALQKIVRQYYWGIGVKEDREIASKLEKQLLRFSEAQLQRDFYEYGRIDFTPLHHAVQQNNINGIQNHINEYSIFIDISDEDGWTPLHHAAEKGRVEIMKLLVCRGNVNTRKKDSMTPVGVRSIHNSNRL